jgi:hypothetical protein
LECALKVDRAAKFVEDSILFGVPERHELFPLWVTANHVHLFVKPVIGFKYLMQGIKGFTAHTINGALGTRGETFWQDESFDHWPRDEEEMFRLIHYIEHNPVNAGSAQGRKNGDGRRPASVRIGLPASRFDRGGRLSRPIGGPRSAALLPSKRTVARTNAIGISRFTSLLSGWKA